MLVLRRSGVEQEDGAKGGCNTHAPVVRMLELRRGAWEEQRLEVLDGAEAAGEDEGAVTETREMELVRELGLGAYDPVLRRRAIECARESPRCLREED